MRVAAFLGNTAELYGRNLNLLEIDSFEFDQLKILVNFHLWSGIGIFLKCQISYRDLASLHVVPLLYLVREGVWEGA